MFDGNINSRMGRRKANWRLWHVANLPAMLATVAVLLAAVTVDHFIHNRHHIITRHDLQSEINVIAARMQGLIRSNVELVRGLASTIATEPDIGEERFSKLSRSLFHNDTQLDYVAASPDYITTLVYPQRQYNRLIGVDVRSLGDDPKLFKKSRYLGLTFLGKPTRVAGGDMGIVVRYPIYQRNQRHERHFWGMLSGVISSAEIFHESGLTGNKAIMAVLVGKDNAGAFTDNIWGSADVMDAGPVSQVIDFGVGEWQLAAVPKGGWEANHPNSMAVQIVLLVGGFLIILPMTVAGWLFQERIAHVDADLENQRRMKHLTKRLDLALEASGIGVWEIDYQTGRIHWDQRMNELYGVDGDPNDNDNSWEALAHPEDRQRVVETFEELRQSLGRCKIEFRIVMPNGSERTIRRVGSMLIDKHGNERMIGVDWDISEYVERERELQAARAEGERRHQELLIAKTKIEMNAMHDFLTGLPNRRYLDQALRKRCIGGCEDSNEASLLKVDLDGFKTVNDKYGHSVGDKVLQRFSELLRRATNKDDFTARIGGDEFVILCQTGDDPERAETLAATIIEEASQPMDINGSQCRLGASVGVANCASAHGDYDKWLSHADLALYDAKHRGRSCFTFFSEALYDEDRKKRQLAEDLMRGIENREFIAYYQGQYCSDSHKLTGVEALARWQHPDRGIVSPFEFVELAESLGIMGAIDAMVLEEALAALGFWKERGLDVPSVSVNVSAKRLGDKELIPNLNKLDFDPDRLTFELVESTFLDRSDAQVAENIRQIREMGIDIEIDDFGTAYASIVSLTHLLPNRLKIDRELVTPLIESADQRELLNAIIHIGRTLGIGIVAEGVESIEHAQILRVMGVDTLQGYAFCRPLSRMDFLKKHKSKKNKDGQAA